MAVDKLVDSTQLDADLTSVANAIRTKGGTSAQMAFPAGFISAVENIPGGASKGVLLLDTVTVPSDIRAVNLDFTDYQNLDFFFVVEDVTLSSSDWLYYVRNVESPRGGTYDASALAHLGVCFVQINKVPISSINGARSLALGTTNNYSGSTSNLYIYTYVSSKLILAGSKFYICGGGGNYADL